MSAAADPARPPADTKAGRAALLDRLMGSAPSWTRPFVASLRTHVAGHYDRHVVPLIRRHWPESLESPEGDKLQFLACRLYAAAAYTALFCSQRKPRLISTLLGAATLPWMTPRILASMGRPVLNLVARTSLAREQRLVVLVGSYVATVDQLFDHMLDSRAPAERAAVVRGLVQGTRDPAPGAESLVRAIQASMESNLGPGDEAPYRHAIAQVIDWAEAEARALEGVPDPEGICHRGAGTRGTIDGLLFPLHRFADESVRHWMYDVSLWTQVMDDWLDEEDDREAGRETPVSLGIWQERDVVEGWEGTLSGIEALGHGNPVLAAFLRAIYVSQMRDVMRAMAHGLAS